MLVGVAALFLLAGCHGGAQTDIVERELRWQEDQIYAMEDYISEYQQLLCQYRAENSALKLQLASGQRSRPVDRQIRRDQQKIQDTEEIIENVLPPEVPPLIDTMPPPPGASQMPQFGPDLNFRPARRPTRGVRRTALEEQFEQPVDQLEELSPAVEPIALDEAFAEEAVPVEVAEGAPEEEMAPEPFQNVVVRGDVLPDDGENGPRLLVEVEPLGASGGPADFSGELSLMILDTSGAMPRGIARWDFSPDQLAELLGEDTGPTMEFPLQLPAETPTDRPLEIWARLVPPDAEKVLAHAELHLDQPGAFSSVRPRPVVLEEQISPQLAASGPGPGFATGTVRIDPIDRSTGEGDGWQIARPDQPGAVSPARRAPTSQWRKATQPIPTAMNYGRPVAASAEANSVEPARLAHRVENEVKAPTWSPEREGLSALTADEIASPAWSPER